MARNRRKTRKSSKKNQKKLLIELFIFFVILLGSSLGIISNNSDTDSNTSSKTTTIRENQNLFKPTTSIDNTVQNDLDFTDGMYIYYFNVGQGDCSLIISDNKTMLIDAGNNEDGSLIVNYLNELGIKKIDYLVGTHPHEDHIGGLDDVIDSFEIGTIYMPKVSSTTKTFEDVLDSISNKNLTITTVNIGDKFALGKANGEILFVDNNYSGDSYNDCSIVINLEYESQNFLFMADAEESIEKDLNLSQVAVLKVGHHGSSTSTSEEFIKNIAPSVSIISCGADNSYGHPHKQTIEVLKDVHSKIYRTDEKGTILLKASNNFLDINFLNVSLDGNNS